MGHWTCKQPLIPIVQSVIAQLLLGQFDHDSLLVYGAPDYFCCVCHDRWFNRRGGKRLRRRQ